MLRGSMALDEEDLQLLRSHYATHAKAEAAQCPICESTTWTADGPIAAPELLVSPTGGVMVGERAMPMVILICNTCSFVRHFSWGRIKKGITGV